MLRFCPILQGFSQMRFLDLFAPRKVSYGARDFEQTVIAAAGKAETVYRAFGKGGAGGIELTEFAEFFDRHFGVGDEGAVSEARELALARRDHARTDRF